MGIQKGIGNQKERWKKPVQKEGGQERREISEKRRFSKYNKPSQRLGSCYWERRALGRLESSVSRIKLNSLYEEKRKKWRVPASFCTLPNSVSEQFSCVIGKHSRHSKLEFWPRSKLPFPSIQEVTVRSQTGFFTIVFTLRVLIPSTFHPNPHPPVGATSFRYIGRLLCADQSTNLSMRRSNTNDHHPVKMERTETQKEACPEERNLGRTTWSWFEMGDEVNKFIWICHDSSRSGDGLWREQVTEIQINITQWSLSSVPSMTMASRAPFSYVKSQDWRVSWDPDQKNVCPFPFQANKNDNMDPSCEDE